MEHYTIEQRIFIVKHYCKNDESLVAKIREVRPFLIRNNVPNSTTVKKTIEIFASPDLVLDIAHDTSCSDTKSAAVLKSMAKTPETSIRHGVNEMDISTARPHRILTQDLYLHTPNAIKSTTFINRPCTQKKVNFDFLDKHIFQCQGSLASRWQNCRIWGLGNPRVIVDIKLHPKCLTIWCVLWSAGIIRPLFFEGEAGSS